MRFLLPYAVLALLYIASMGRLEPLPGALLKVLPVCWLLLWAWLEGRTGRALLMGALLAGLAGDLSLAFDRFNLGLGCFLAGHLFYIAIWLQRLDLNRWRRTLPVLGFYLFCLWRLLPHAGDQSLVVGIYVTVICTMATCAALSPVAGWWGLAGACSFLVSDFAIGWNRFIEPLAWERPFVMSSYYLAQVLLAGSVIAWYRSR